MCCLRYEHDFYVQSRKRFPKEGRILATALGEEKVLANDIFNDRVTLRGPEGDTRVVPLADLRRELDRVAEGAISPVADAEPVAPHESLEEIVDSAVAVLPTVPMPMPMTVTDARADRPDAALGAEAAGSEGIVPDEPAAQAVDEQRARRRRGRRGGRRGKRNGERGSTPSEE
jgi:hypothetical protein